jgi:hypothetical protein
LAASQAADAFPSLKKPAKLFDAGQLTPDAPLLLSSIRHLIDQSARLKNEVNSALLSIGKLGDEINCTRSLCSERVVLRSPADVSLKTRSIYPRGSWQTPIRPSACQRKEKDFRQLPPIGSPSLDLVMLHRFRELIDEHPAQYPIPSTKAVIH